MISGKPQAHTRAEGGDGGGPKAEAHSKRDKGGAQAQQTAHARSETGEAITLTHTQSGPRKVGVGNSQRLRARS